MKKNYYIFIVLYFVLNILNTYFLTSIALNRYIAPFKYTFAGTLNAIIGNFSILLLLYFIVAVIFKNTKNRMRMLLIVTLILNLLIFALGIFNLFYGTSFFMKNLIMFKNPAEGFAFGIVKEVLLELITYYRILVFVPTFILLFLVIRYKKGYDENLRFKNYFIILISSLLLLVFSFFTYSFNFIKNYNIRSLQSSYANQNFGVYAFLFTDVIGVHPLAKPETNINDDNLLDLINLYNKNKTSYNNFFNQQMFSNRLTKDQTINNLFVDYSLTKTNDLHGILKDRNLVLIHLESFNYFLLENNYTKNQLPFLQAIMEESLVFHQFYNNVGMGVSSDAELAVLTGLNPLGDETLYWEYDNKEYILDNLPSLFNEADYYTKAIHGDNGTFYNRDVVYDKLFNFQESYFLEDFIADGYIVDEGYVYNKKQNLIHYSPWISDYHLADEVTNIGKNLNQKYFLFSVTMMGHTPYDFNPIEIDQLRFPKNYKYLNSITKKYINYAQYYDETIKRYFRGDKSLDNTLDNTVYVFYSDHGSGIKNGDLKTLFGKNLSVIEQRKMLQRTLAFIYVPGTEYTMSNNYIIRKGLLTGNQHLIRSEIDLYRTIIELFDLPIGDHPYFGVHGLSKERTFALENRLMDVALDSYFFSMRNRKTDYGNTINKSIYEYILDYKKLQDFILNDEDNQLLITEKNKNQN